MTRPTNGQRKKLNKISTNLIDSGERNTYYGMKVVTSGEMKKKASKGKRSQQKWRVQKKLLSKLNKFLADKARETFENMKEV